MRDAQGSPRRAHRRRTAPCIPAPATPAQSHSA
jgi:hypothetical protein